MQIELRDDVSAEDSRNVVDHRECGQHQERRDQTRSHELLDRVGAHHIERVDLFRHAHGADLCRDARSDASGDHEAGENRTELPDHGSRNQAPHIGRRAEALHLNRGLQRQHHSRKKSGKNDDAE